MALRAGYYGVKRWLWDKLQSVPVKVDGLIDSNNITGAKNLIDVTQTVAGHSKAVISSITSSGFTVTTSESAANVASRTPLNLIDGGKYILTVKVTAITGSGKKITIRNSSQTIVAYKDVTAVGDYELSFTYTTGDTFAVFVTGSTAATGSITVDKVMVRLASDTDATYEPYSMTNRQLTKLSSLETANYDNTTVSANISAVAYGIYKKYGEVNQVSGKFTTSSSINAWTNLFKIPGAANMANALTVAIYDHTDPTKAGVFKGDVHEEYVRLSLDLTASHQYSFDMIYLSDTQAIPDNRSAAPDERSLDVEVEEPVVVKKTTRKKTTKTEEEE